MANMAVLKRAMDAGKAPQKCKSVLVYGAAFSGKSAKVAQLAEHYRLIWLDIENGHSVLFNQSLVPPAYLNNIELVCIPDNRNDPKGIEYTMKLFEGTALKLCDAHGRAPCPKCMRDKEATYTTVDLHKLDPVKDIVVLDSLTQATRSAASYIIKKQLGNNDEAKFEFDHWRLQNVYIDKLLDMAQAGIFNVVVITHEQGIEQADGVEKITPSGSTKNYARTIAKNFDTVLYMAVQGTRHRIFSNTDEAPKAITGSRIEVNVEKDGICAVFNPRYAKVQEKKRLLVKRASSTTSTKTS